MSISKRIVLSVALLAALTSATVSHARGRGHVDVIYYGGGPLGLSTVMCMVGYAEGCLMLSALAALVTTFVALDRDSYKQNTVLMAQEDARDYLLGGEMTIALEEAMGTFRQAAHEQGVSEVDALSTSDLAGYILSYQQN